MRRTILLMLLHQSVIGMACSPTTHRCAMSQAKGSMSQVSSEAVVPWASPCPSARHKVAYPVNVPSSRMCFGSSSQERLPTARQQAEIIRLGLDTRGLGG